jgi:hypothetical protein
LSTLAVSQESPNSPSKNAKIFGVANFRKFYLFVFGAKIRGAQEFSPTRPSWQTGNSTPKFLTHKNLQQLIPQKSLLVTYTASEPFAVVIKFRHTVPAEFAVNCPWRSENLTTLTEFYSLGLVGKGVGFWVL